MRLSGLLAVTAALSLPFLPAGAQELVPLHVSADSGFFTLLTYRGKVFGGTYGGRIYRIDVDEFVEEARFPSTESVFVLATDPGERLLIANLERTEKLPTVMYRNDANGTWQSMGVGDGYPEQEEAMGLGAGYALGELWVASTPMVDPAKGYVWSTADGVNWTPRPGFPTSVPKAFAEFNGTLVTATTFSDDDNQAIYWWNGAGWVRQFRLPDGRGGCRMLPTPDNLFLTAERNVYSIDRAGNVGLVLAKPSGFFQDLALFYGNDGSPALVTVWSQGWRAAAGGSELWYTLDGVNWALYQTFPEPECWGVAVRGCDLFVGTRDDDGHGRIYHLRMAWDVDGDGHVADACGGDDCDDGRADRHPGLAEVCADGVDQDCDGVDPPCPCPDQDGDGHQAAGCGGDDCDDGRADVHPGQPETCGDGVDQDCDGVDPPCPCPDQDGDGHQALACGGDDCDDGRADVHPGQPETCGDGVDQDCDGVDPPCPCPDQDGDGHQARGCGGDDCDDGRADVHPGMLEVCGDGVDQDCDGADMPCPAGDGGVPDGGHLTTDAGADEDARGSSDAAGSRDDVGLGPEERLTQGMDRFDSGCACRASSNGARQFPGVPLLLLGAWGLSFGQSRGPRRPPPARRDGCRCPASRGPGDQASSRRPPAS